jgi:hypothetical protein
VSLIVLVFFIFEKKLFLYNANKITDFFKARAKSVNSHFYLRIFAADVFEATAQLEISTSIL